MFKKILTRCRLVLIVIKWRISTLARAYLKYNRTDTMTIAFSVFTLDFGILKITETVLFSKTIILKRNTIVILFTYDSSLNSENECYDNDLKTI